MHPALSNIVDAFEFCEKSQRLELLIEFGDKLRELDERLVRLRNSGQHIVSECQSPVFILPEVQDGMLRVHGDVPREASIARGFVGLLVEAFDKQDLSTLNAAPEDILTELRIRESLTARRRRGLAAIYQRVLDATRYVTDRILVTALVMAAGKSERMGQSNKLLLKFHDKPLVSHVVANILGSSVHDVIVVVGFEADGVRDVLADHKVRTIYNPEFGAGINTSIRSGIKNLKEGTSGFMVCLADQPLIQATEYQILLRAFETAIRSNANAIVVPYYNKQRGNPVILSSTYASAVERLLPDEGFRRIVETNVDHVTAVEMPTDHILVDVDTIDSFRKISQQQS